jgi:hypothetical protein
MLLDAAHIIADKDERLGQPVVTNGIRALREDTEFARLLQAEQLNLMPAFLEQQLAARPAK